MPGAGGGDPLLGVPSVQCKQEMENQIGSAHIYQGRDLASYWKPTRVFPLADRRCVVIVLWPSTSTFSSNKKKMILLTQSSWTFGQLGYVWLNSSSSSSSSSKCRHCQSQSLHLDSWTFGHLWLSKFTAVQHDHDYWVTSFQITKMQRLTVQVHLPNIIQMLCFCCFVF